jgi:hypothetical protein
MINLGQRTVHLTRKATFTIAPILGALMPNTVPFAIVLVRVAKADIAVVTLGLRRKES